MSKKNKEEKLSGEYMTIGMCIGVSIGAMLDNLALWLSVGMLLGLAFDEYTLKKKKKDSAKNNDDK